MVVDIESKPNHLEEFSIRRKLWSISAEESSIKAIYVLSAGPTPIRKGMGWLSDRRSEPNAPKTAKRFSGCLVLQALNVERNSESVRRRERATRWQDGAVRGGE